MMTDNVTSNRNHFIACGLILMLHFWTWIKILTIHIEWLRFIFNDFVFFEKFSWKLLNFEFYKPLKNLNSTKPLNFLNFTKPLKNLNFTKPLKIYAFSYLIIMLSQSRSLVWIFICIKQICAAEKKEKKTGAMLRVKLKLNMNKHYIIYYHVLCLSIRVCFFLFVIIVDWKTYFPA